VGQALVVALVEGRLDDRLDDGAGLHPTIIAHDPCDATLWRRYRGSAADDDLFTDDVLERPASWGVLLRRGFLKRCPRCGGRKVYRSWFRMHERCPTCGMAFEREEGFFVGAYLINFAITEVALFVVIMGLIVALSQDADASLTLPLVLGAFFAVAGPLITYPWSRTIWSAIVLAMHPLELEEIVAARDHLRSRQAAAAPDP
jgi:uncharacterized protein (DUF983 family)